MMKNKLNLSIIPMLGVTAGGHVPLCPPPPAESAPAICNVNGAVLHDVIMYGMQSKWVRRPTYIGSSSSSSYHTSMFHVL